MTPEQQARTLYFLSIAEIRNANEMRELNKFLKELGVEHAPRAGCYEPPKKKKK